MAHTLARPTSRAFNSVKYGSCPHLAIAIVLIPSFTRKVKRLELIRAKKANQLRVSRHLAIQMARSCREATSLAAPM
jgi:hypothetical protein